jgi:hypothetical protein
MIDRNSRQGRIHLKWRQSCRQTLQIDKTHNFFGEWAVQNDRGGNQRRLFEIDELTGLVTWKKIAQRQVGLGPSNARPGQPDQ